MGMSWHPSGMELKELSLLEADDQWLLLLGRISAETVRMETQLRGLHAWLHHGEVTRELLFRTPRSWSQLHKETRKRIRGLDIEPDVREAIVGALKAAHRANDGRNKYMHRELLRHEQWDTEEPPPTPTSPHTPDSRLRVEVSNQSGIPAPEPVTLQQAHELVSDLIGAGWRLRFARLHLESPESWKSELTAHVVGTWDGNADLTGGVDDD